MIFYKALFFFSFCLISIYSFKCQNNLDSVNLKILHAENDSIKYEHLYSKVKIFRTLGLLDSALAVTDKMITLSADSEALKTRSYIIKSSNYQITNDLESSEKVLLDYILELSESNHLQLANVYDRLAMIVYGKGDITKSIKYFFSSLKHHKILGDPLATYRALAILYGQLNDLDKAFYYNEKVIELAIETDDKNALARAYLSQGYQYKELNKNALSLASSTKAVDIYINELNDPTDERLSLIYGNIAEVYLYFHENYLDSVIIINPNFNRVNDLSKAVLDTAESYVKKSIAISEIKKLDHQIYNARNSYGDLLFYKKEYKGSLKEFLKSYNVCEGKVNMMSNEIIATKKLAEVYKVLGKPKESLFYLEKNVLLQDSLYNDEKKLELGKLEGKLEAEAEKLKIDIERVKNEAIEHAKLKKVKAIENALNNKRLIIIYSISIGIILLLVFTYYMYKRLKYTSKQKNIIEKQKEVIEKNRNNMLSSIEYSKIIQKKIFPSQSLVKQLLPNSFIYFAPKDIVSGDFYWVHKKGNTTYFAVADCTGHGVSGAFMTLIGLNLLESIILENDMDSPAFILERLNVRLKECLSIAKHDKVKHGLDIAMCSYNEFTNELNYAGLHNPIYIINSRNELEELKGDQLYLGISKKFKVTNHIIKINTGDTIYLCTDGFADQKGGEKNKKFYYSRLRKTLIVANTTPLDNRVLYLKKTFENWKGEKEQVDDVCIMGVSF